MASIDTATQTTSLDQTAAAVRLELFEPAMCCSSGVCGPSPDQQLIDVREDLRWAEGQGASVARHNLTNEPDAFVANPKVTGLMQAFGDGALPALVLDGEIVVHGRYPTRDDLAALIAGNAEVKPSGAELPQAGGCAPGSGCC